MRGTVVVCAIVASACGPEEPTARPARPAPADPSAAARPVVASRDAAPVAPPAPVTLPAQRFDHAAVFGRPPSAARKLWGKPRSSQGAGADTLVSWRAPGYTVGVFYEQGEATAITVGLRELCATQRRLTEADRATVAAWVGWTGPRCSPPSSNRLSPGTVARFDLYPCGFRIDAVSADICARTGGETLRPPAP